MDYVSLKNLLEKFATRRSKATDDMNITDIERFYPEVMDADNSFGPNNTMFGRFGDFNLMSNATVASDDLNSVLTSEYIIIVDFIDFIH